MTNIRNLLTGVVLAALVAHGGMAVAEDGAVISLSAPRMEGGLPLFQALKERKSTKEFSKQPLTRESLSNLLWAAFGINRPDSGMRTAPSAKNKQEVSIYAVTAEGAYLYDAAANQLKRVAEGDLRKTTGSPESAGGPPVELVYVADFQQSGGKTEEDKRLYASITTGCIIQNVYLFCASEKLATVTRVVSNREALAQALRLTKDQWPVMTQSVGFPLK
ncbi:MAG: SagB/ThcOx family dehydrogenase [Candidatus Hydrogenedentes bacterium]|nr:SagB/ThcOx family dehydrogenase [Candidatus Hydrogenedentota bacterium]